MSVSYCGVQREQVLKQLHKDTGSKIEGLAQLTELGIDGAACLGLAGEVAALLKDPSDEVQLAAMDALGGMGEVAAQDAENIVPLLESQNDQKRCLAAGTLGLIGPHALRYASKVAQGLSDQKPTVRAATCLALGNMRAVQFTKDVGMCVSDKFSDVVQQAIAALPMLDGAEARKLDAAVAKHLGSVDREVVLAALRYFTAFSDLAPARASEFCKLLQHEDTVVRSHVADVYGAVKDKHQAMIDGAAKVLSHQDSRFKTAAAMAIGKLGAKGKSQADAITKLLNDTTEDKSQDINCVAGIETKAPSTIRIPACAAMSALTNIGAEVPCAKISELASTDNPAEVRSMAAVTLGEIGTDEELLVPLLSAPHAQLRASAVLAAGKLVQRLGAKPALTNKVADCLVDKSPIVRAAAATALGSMGDEATAFTEVLLGLFGDSSIPVRAAAIGAFPGLGGKGTLYAPDIARRMDEEHLEPWEVKVACVQSLAAMGVRGAAFAEEVVQLVHDLDSRVRLAVLEALAKMGGDARPFLADALGHAKQDQLKEVRDAAERALEAVEPATR